MCLCGCFTVLSRGAPREVRGRRKSCNCPPEACRQEARRRADHPPWKREEAREATGKGSKKRAGRGSRRGGAGEVLQNSETPLRYMYIICERKRVGSDLASYESLGSDIKSSAEFTSVSKNLHGIKPTKLAEMQGGLPLLFLQLKWNTLIWIYYEFSARPGCCKNKSTGS